MKLTNSTPDDPSKYTPLYLRRLARKIPGWLAVLEIRVLMQLTVSAMEEACPAACNGRGKAFSRHKGITRKACLQQYQQYTRTCLENRSDAELSVMRDAMYRKAFAAGRLLGKLPGLTNDAARTTLVRLLYKNIGIRIEGSMPGAVDIPRCSFSSCYTPQICAVMSGMDAGIICGIFGGGTLIFTERLTEGSPACKAVYRRN